MNSTEYLIIGLLLVAICGIMVIIYILEGEKRHPHGHHHKPKLRLRVYFHNKIKNHLMANSVTLTDLLPHKGVISVIDQNGNSYAGKLSNIQVTSSDSTVDTAGVDPNDPNTLDVTAVTKTGGSTINFTADFTPDSPIDGQTSFTGLQGTATIVNNVTTQLSLQVSF